MDIGKKLDAIMMYQIIILRALGMPEENVRKIGKEIEEILTEEEK